MRNYSHPSHIKFRKAVLRRDNYKCKWPKCASKKGKSLRVHHIKKWANSPHLRFNVQNGITLCSAHHGFVRNREHLYESLFMSILL